MGRVLAIGSVNTDLVCRAAALPRPGETVRGASFATYPGGKGANQAVAAARAGAAVTFVGAVGDDAFGDARRADLGADGVDVERLRGVPGAATGTALIVVDADGANQIVMVPGANDLISADEALAALRDVPHAAVSLTLETPLEVVRAVLQHKRPGTAVVLNVAPWLPAAGELLGRVDAVICNELEAAALLGCATLDDPAGAARALAARGPGLTIITRGADGAVVAGAGDAWAVPAPRVKAIDTTAAGDAFCGAFTAWLSEGRPARECVAAGVQAGALAVTRHGAQPSLPRRAEIEAALRAEPCP